MSAPTRVVTPRLEAAITAVVQRMDAEIETLEPLAIEYAKHKRLAAHTRRELAAAKAVRAELLEALEEAVKS